jgi:hypothetical protein
MSYGLIDEVILAWVQRHALTLFTSIEGMKDVTFRSAYTSSDSGECCQIWIDPPEGNDVTLHAAGVEMRTDEEFKRDWCVPVAELDNGLENALSSVKQWMARDVD